MRDTGNGTRVRASWTRATAALRVAMLTGVAFVAPTRTVFAMPVIGARTVDANGVEHYPITSIYQGAAPTQMRVLRPSGATAGTQYRFLFVLPVEAELGTVYGDGLDVLRALGVHDRYGLIVVAPSFHQLPWYADHPTDPTIRQESFLVEDIVAAVDILFPQPIGGARHARRLLLGFSKSGMGAISMILRHADVFDAAAAWDATLNQTTLSGLPGGSSIFGTQANLDGYAIPRVLASRAAPFVAESRLWLGGYSGWRSDMIASHDQMTTLGMQHTWVDGPMRVHSWPSGWVEGAVTSLVAMAPPLPASVDAGVDGGVVDVAVPVAADGFNAFDAADGRLAPDGTVADGSRDGGTRPPEAQCGCVAVAHARSSRVFCAAILCASLLARRRHARGAGS